MLDTSCCGAIAGSDGEDRATPAITAEAATSPPAATTTTIPRSFAERAISRAIPSV
jgi:hypothetical protein